MGINWFHFSAAVEVKFSPLSDTDGNKRVECGDAIVLYCEVSHPSIEVCWFKDGNELVISDSLNIQSEGRMRRIVIQSADASHSGVYTCETSGDVLRYNVEVTGNSCYHGPAAVQGFAWSSCYPISLHPPLFSGPPVEFCPVPEEELHKSSMELDPVVLLCHVSAEEAEVSW